MLNNYLTLINSQRIKNNSHKKDYRLLELPKQNRSYVEVIDSLNKFPNAFFSNTIERTKPLYQDTQDNFYYEFIDKSAGSYTNMESWRYFYIPLSQYNIIASKLPSFKFYDVNFSSEVLTYYLTNNILYVNKTNLKASYILDSNESFKHPLAPHFIFTGGITLLKDGKMVYEYKDSKGYSDYEDISYLSLLSPIDLYIPATIVNNFQFTEDFILRDYLNKPSSKLNLYNKNNKTFEFSGRTTNKYFSAYKKWYEYYENEDGFPIGTILLPYPPTFKSLDFVKTDFYNKNIGFNLNQVDNNQFLTIQQFSSNKKINIA